MVIVSLSDICSYKKAKAIHGGPPWLVRMEQGSVAAIAQVEARHLILQVGGQS